MDAVHILDHLVYVQGVTNTNLAQNVRARPTCSRCFVYLQTHGSDNPLELESSNVPLRVATTESLDVAVLRSEVAPSLLRQASLAALRCRRV